MNSKISDDDVDIWIIIENHRFLDLGWERSGRLLSDFVEDASQTKIMVCHEQHF